MVSIRIKLLGLIFLSTVLAWGFAAYRSFLDTRHEINELFDAHLAESARAILQQAEHEQREENLRQDADDHGEESQDDNEKDDESESFNIPEVHKRGALFEKRLLFQLRDASGHFMMGSMRGPRVEPLASVSTDGFSEGHFKGHAIRVFSTWNQQRTLNIQVAESLGKRNALIKGSIQNVLAPILVMILPLLLLLAFVVEYALRPMSRLSREVERRTPDDLARIDDQSEPREMRPMVQALNSLFLRLERALANERRFTADAAHELRTPLAAIKVQAQVALRAEGDEVTRNHALKGVSKGVDRATHLVEQLLTMARLDPETELHGERVQLRNLVVDVASHAVSEAAAKNLELVVGEGPELAIHGNPAMLRILVRNLLDNAVRYTPVDGIVHINVMKVEDGIHLVVDDSGPGLSEEQSKLVTGRFSRVSRPSGEGSGLGLSIVNRIADLHKAKLVFSKPGNGIGCRVQVIFSADRGS